MSCLNVIDTDVKNGRWCILHHRVESQSRIKTLSNVYATLLDSEQFYSTYLSEISNLYFSASKRFGGSADGCEVSRFTALR